MNDSNVAKEASDSVQGEELVHEAVVVAVFLVVLPCGDSDLLHAVTYVKKLSIIS